MRTLFDIWQRDTPGDYVAGVRLLQEAGWGELTKKIQGDLLQLCFSGEAWSWQMRGKVECGLKRCGLENRPLSGVYPTPNPSPEGEGSLPSTTMRPLPFGGGVGGGVNSGEGPVLQKNSPQSKLTSPAAIALHKRHSHHHALLVSATTDEERAKHATEIMQKILPALDKEYDRLRAGAAPETEFVADPPVESPGANEADLIRRLASLRARMSKLSRHLIPNAGTLTRKQQLEAELAAKQQEAAGIEALLA